MDLFVNPENSVTLDPENRNLFEAEVQSIVDDSVDQWNGQSSIALRKNVTSGVNQLELNEIYFSSDNIFGSGVIGLTMVNFNDTNGEISSADIILNNNFDFSTDPLSRNFLGNVITHELGHFVGLGHGQVVGSTMFYDLSLGQHKISEDDKSGIYSLYPSGDPGKGSLSGTIVGSKKLVQVFGAQVQAISVKTGKVMGASVSELDGKFKIDGLPTDDQYVLYTSPIKQMGLPSNYTKAKSDFCESSTKYRGSFFQSCGSSSEGFPQAVRLNSSSLDVGRITIRCGLDTPPDYMQNKNITPASFDLTENTSTGLGGSFVGFFSAAELLPPGTSDYFKLNFTQVDNWAIYSSKPIYLEVKVMNQAFYSAFKANVQISRVATAEVLQSIPYIQEPDGWVNLETIERMEINVSNPSDNEFEVKISPAVITTSFPQAAPGIQSFSKSELFPSYTDAQENLYFYLVTATIVQKNVDGTFTQIASKNDLLSDNTNCPDAMNTYALTNYSAKGTSSNSERKSGGGCGIVVDQGQGPGSGKGPGGFLVGLLLCFIIANVLSRYSKMA